MRSSASGPSHASEVASGFRKGWQWRRTRLARRQAYVLGGRSGPRKKVRGTLAVDDGGQSCGGIFLSNY